MYIVSIFVINAKNKCEVNVCLLYFFSSPELLGSLVG